MATNSSRILLSAGTLLGLLIAVYLLVGPVANVVAHASLSGLSPTDQASTLNTTRATAVAAVGVVGGILTAALALPRYFAAKDRQRIDRFHGAVEHLLSDSSTGRLSGVVELDAIMNTSPADIDAARRVLAQFIREHSPRQFTTDDQEQTSLPGDVAAAISVLGKPRKHSTSAKRARLDLRLANLVAAELGQADLAEAQLGQADLSRADLAGSVLTGAHLTECVLVGASLARSHCAAADLSRATLTRSDLTGADLTGCVLIEADLTGALLLNADLTGAQLRDARLAGADLRSCRGLTTEQIAGAYVDSATQLPSGVNRPEPRIR